MTTAVQVQYRRDTAANVASFTGAAGEAVVDTTNWRWVVQDGATAGGYPHALVANLPFGSFKNLMLGNVAGPQSFTAPTTPNNQAKIKADFLSAFNATLGVSTLLSSVSVTADVTVSGVNGVDTGAVAINTWYAIFVIYNPTTKTTAALLSTSSTSPTLPSGYTYLARVGWMRTDPSSHFFQVLQQGRKAQYVIGANPIVPRNIVNGAAGTLSGNSPILSTFSLANFVPPTAAVARLLISTSYLGFTTGGVIVAPNANWGGTNNGPSGSGGSVWPFYFAAGGGPSSMDGVIELMIEGSNPGWASNNNSGAISILGWEDNL